ncbi:hypothetical protein PMAYCL1PPCAC_21764, partial [Pristionchus mayeri]
AQMWRLLTLFALRQFVFCTCSENFRLIKDGECRGLGGTDVGTFADAAFITWFICDELIATAMVFNFQHYYYWVNEESVPLSDGYMIMGLLCNTTSREWVWTDMSPLDYKPTKAYYDPALDKPCVPGASWYLHPNSSWLLGVNNKDPINILSFCTTQLEHPTPEDAGCDEEDELCYPIVPSGENWQDGEATCKRFDGNLASIHNKQENNFVRRQAVALYSSHAVFIGAKAGNDGVFQWIDGTEMDFVNWAPGYPKENFGDCAALDWYRTAGQWMNIDCNAKLPAACMVNKAPDVVPACTGQAYEEGAIFTSPGYPFSSNTPCEYLLEVPAGKQLQLEIIYLESNECCDSLVLHDAHQGGHQIAK